MVPTCTGTRSMIAVCFCYRKKLYRINIIRVSFIVMYILFQVTLKKWLSLNTISLNNFARVPVPTCTACISSLVCGTVSSMLSGLKTRSLGQNVISSLVTVCPSRSSVNRFLDSTSTKQGKCDLLKATTKCAPAGVRTRDPLVRNPTP